MLYKVNEMTFNGYNVDSLDLLYIVAILVLFVLSIILLVQCSKFMTIILLSATGTTPPPPDKPRPKPGKFGKHMKSFLLLSLVFALSSIILSGIIIVGLGMIPSLHGIHYSFSGLLDYFTLPVISCDAPQAWYTYSEDFEVHTLNIWRYKLYLIVIATLLVSVCSLYYLWNKYIKHIYTSDMPGVPGRRCPTCLERGQSVWVVPGKDCPQCGTPVV